MKWSQPLVHHGVATTYILPERRLLTNYSDERHLADRTYILPERRLLTNYSIQTTL